MSIYMSIASIAISMLTLWIASRRQQYDIQRENILGEIHMTPLHTQVEEPLIDIVSVEPHLKDQLIIHFNTQNLGWTIKFMYNHAVLISDDMQSETLFNPGVTTEGESNRHYFRVNRLYYQEIKPVVDIANTGPYTLYGWKYVGTFCTHYLISHKDNCIYLYTTRKKPLDSELF